MTTTAKSTAKKSTARVSRKVTVRTEVAGDIRPQLRKAYLYVVQNWAVEATEVAKALKIEVKDANALLRRIRSANLVVGEQVNGEGALVWQSYYDIENDDKKDGVKKARADFAAAFPKPVVPGSSNRTGAKGATGPRYTDEQIKAGLAARKQGKTNVEVAKAAGVKSPAYFSKVLKGIEAAKPARKVAVKTTAKRAAKK